jgi:methyl-accepting chemotaxis protein
VSIRTKLSIVFAVSLAQLLLISGFVLVRMEQIRSESSQLADHVVPSLITIDQISTVIGQYRVAQSSHISAMSEVEQQAVESRMRTLEQRMDRLLADLDQIARAEDRADYERLRTLWPEFVEQTQTELLPTSRSRIAVRTFAAYNGLEGEYQSMLAAIADLVAVTRQDSRDVLERSATLVSTSRMIVLVVIAFALLGFVLAWLAIVRPLRGSFLQLLGATRAISRGDLGHEPPHFEPCRRPSHRRAPMWWRVSLRLSSRRASLSRRWRACAQRPRRAMRWARPFAR